MAQLEIRDFSGNLGFGDFSVTISDPEDALKVALNSRERWNLLRELGTHDFEDGEPLHLINLCLHCWYRYRGRLSKVRRWGHPHLEEVWVPCRVSRGLSWPWWIRSRHSLHQDYVDEGNRRFHLGWHMTQVCFTQMTQSIWFSLDISKNVNVSLYFNQKYVVSFWMYIDYIKSYFIHLKCEPSPWWSSGGDGFSVLLLETNLFKKIKKDLL